jgi:hypothetical protein
MIRHPLFVWPNPDPDEDRAWHVIVEYGQGWPSFSYLIVFADLTQVIEPSPQMPHAPEELGG